MIPSPIRVDSPAYPLSEEEVGGDLRETWREYEQAKRKLQQAGLTPEQYEVAIKALVARLGI